jgi:hypothetical protein
MPKGGNQNQQNEEEQINNTMVKRKRTNNDLQNTTQKSKDRTTRISLKTGINSGAPNGKDKSADHTDLR